MLPLYSAVLSSDGLFADLIDLRGLYGAGCLRLTVNRGSVRLSAGAAPDALDVIGDYSVGVSEVSIPLTRWVKVERLTGNSSTILVEILPHTADKRNVTATLSSVGIEEFAGGTKIFGRGDKAWLLKPTAKVFWTDGSSPGTVAYEAVVDGVYLMKKNPGSYIFRYHPVAAQLMPHTVTMYVDCDDWSQLGGLSPRFVDSAKAVGWSWLIKSDLTATGNAAWYGSGVRAFTFSISNYNSLIGTPDAATTQIAYFGLRIDGRDTVSAAPTVKIYGIEINGAPVNGRGSVVIGADDALRTWYNDGLPILEKYGLKSYIAVIPDKIGQAGFMTLDNLKDAVARGHECVVHGPLAYESGASLRLKYASDIPGLVNDLRTCRDYLLGNGLAKNGSEKIYVYPQGVADLANYDTTIYDTLRGLGYVAARSTQLATQPRYHPYLRERLDSHNAFMLPIIGHLWAGAGEATNISGIVTTINSVAARRQDAMLVFHEVRATPTINTEIAPASLETICAAIATQISYGALENKTITQQLIGNVRERVPLAGI